MRVYAIAGTIASGKSTVRKLLASKGARTFDCDERIHRYYSDIRSPVYAKVAVLFPKAVQDGRIDRAKLGAVVFKDRKKLALLESVVHPQVLADLAVWMRSVRRSKKTGVAEVPLLFEKNLADQFDGVIYVDVDTDVLLARIVSTYPMSRAQALTRLRLFAPKAFKIQRSNFIVANNAGLDELQKEVDRVWRKIKPR